MMWVVLVVLGVFMWFMSRRNKKRQGDADAFRTELAPNQRVMTASGLVGVISRVEGDVIVIASESGDESSWVRRAIRSLVTEEEWTAMTEEYPEDPEDEVPENADDAEDKPGSEQQPEQG
jgi:preprotein translocase subunit YajC